MGNFSSYLQEDFESNYDQPVQTEEPRTFGLLSEQSYSMINSFIADELYASHFYKHLSNLTRSKGYFGISKYFEEESNSEISHYKIHCDYLNDMNTVALSPTVNQVPIIDFDNIIEIFNDAYNLEKNLLGKYNLYYKDFLKSDDFASAEHLLQFIKIQVKSVGEYSDIITRLNITGNSSLGILLIDKELGA